MRDLEVISGKFFEFEIPKEKRFLLKCFTTPLQQAWLRYFLMFGDIKNFTNHTGWYLPSRTHLFFKDRYYNMMAKYILAKKSLTEEGMEIVDRFERGLKPLTNKSK